MIGFCFAGAALDDSEGRQPLGFYLATIRGRDFVSFALCGIALKDAGMRSLIVVALVSLLSSESLRNAVLNRANRDAEASAAAALVPAQIPAGGSSQLKGILYIRYCDTFKRPVISVAPRRRRRARAPTRRPR